MSRLPKTLTVLALTTALTACQTTNLPLLNETTQTSDAPKTEQVALNAEEVKGPVQEASTPKPYVAPELNWDETGMPPAPALSDFDKSSTYRMMNAMPRAAGGAGDQYNMNLKLTKTFEEHTTLEKATPFAIRNYCHNLLALRRYFDLDECLIAYKKKIRRKTFEVSALEAFMLDQYPWDYYGNNRYEYHLLYGNYALESGQYQKAIKHFEAAEEGYKIYEREDSSAGGQKLNIMMLHVSKGLAMAHAGQVKSAQKVIAELADAGRWKSSGFFDPTSDTRNRLRTAGIAKIHVALGQYQEAKPFVLQSEEFDPEKVLESTAMTHGALGALELAVGVLAMNPAAVIGGVQNLVVGASIADTANENQKTKKEMMEAGYYDHDLFRLKFLHAKIAFETGDLDAAKKEYETLLAAKNIDDFYNLNFTLYQDLAKVAVRDQRSEEAIRLYKLAVESVEKTRSLHTKEAAKIGFVGDKQAIYAELVTLLIPKKEFSQAFEYAERAKSRALVDLLGQQKEFASTSPDAMTLVNELRTLELQPLAVTSTESDQAQDHALRAGSALSSLQSSASELASLVSVDASSAKDVRRQLGANETLLEFFGHGDQLMIFTLSSNRISAEVVNVANLRGKVAGFRRDVQDYGSDRYKTSAKELYAHLIKPVISKLKTRKLTIVAHGPLHYLPFNALYDGKRFLVEKFDIRMLPSASTLAFLKRNSSAKQELLALGNPDLNDPQLDLPGAESETREIKSLVKESQVLLRDQASEENFKKYAAKFKLLHLASHGVFDAADPLQSRMLLSAGGADDGNLTVSELYTMRLNADLVTLSACETAMGEVANGDDVVGLTRGFMYAGANSVVASLWPVSDESTAYFMKTFYRNLGKMPKTSALRRAALATKKEFPHPIFWSAFQITGKG